jgi:hypothetical protein
VAAVSVMPPGVRSNPADCRSTVPVGAADPLLPVTVIEMLMRAEGEAVALLAVAVVVEASNVLGPVTVSEAPGDAVVPLL